MERYGVSRPTAIPAILVIIHRHGILKQNMNRSARVPLISATELPDIHRARKLVEIDTFGSILHKKPGAAEHFESARHALRDTMRALLRNYDENQNDEILRHEFAFHELLIRLPAVPVLQRMFEGIGDVARLAIYQNGVVPPPTLLAQHHIAIVDSLELGFRKNDWEPFREASGAHLLEIMVIPAGAEPPHIVDVPGF